MCWTQCNIIFQEYHHWHVFPMRLDYFPTIPHRTPAKSQCRSITCINKLWCTTLSTLCFCRNGIVVEPVSAAHELRALTHSTRVHSPTQFCQEAFNQIRVSDGSVLCRYRLRGGALQASLDIITISIIDVFLLTRASNITALFIPRCRHCIHSVYMCVYTSDGLIYRYWCRESKVLTLK